ncbi:MAG: LysR family transcriptional regulator [Pseudomonadota bacterium]
MGWSPICHPSVSGKTDNVNRIWFMFVLGYFMLAPWNVDMHLKLRHLEVFNALMEAGSVSHAAERLGVTQPAVSVALATLERELGFRLFHRSRGTFAPTEEARLFHGEAEQGLLAVSRVRQRAQDIARGRAGGLTIASNGAVAINLLPGLIAGFQRDRPEIRVDLQIRTSRQIATLVTGRQVDIGLIDAPVPVAGLVSDVFRLRCVCIMAESDALSHETVVRPSLLAGRSVIAITGDHPIDRRLERLMADADLAVERRVSAAYFAIARNLVSAGAGVALVDEINGCAKLGDGVVWRPFEPRMDFDLAIITAKDRANSGLCAEFLDLLRTQLSGGWA